MLRLGRVARGCPAWWAGGKPCRGAYVPGGVLMSAGGNDQAGAWPETSASDSQLVTAPNLYTEDRRIAEARADFLALYDREYLLVVRFVLRCGASFHAAEDAVQEAFADAWTLTKRPDAWQAIAEARAWIRRVALRKYRRPPGKHRLPVTVPFADMPELPQPVGRHADVMDTTVSLLAALRRLDPEQQAAMAFHLDGFSGPEIASRRRRISRCGH